MSMSLWRVIGNSKLTGMKENKDENDNDLITVVSPLVALQFVHPIAMLLLIQEQA
jgi:hypothetical protein